MQVYRQLFVQRHVQGYPVENRRNVYKIYAVGRSDVSYHRVLEKVFLPTHDRPVVQ